MGKNMRHALTFARKVNGWHTYASDRPTVDAIKRLERRGLVITNQFHQFRIAN